MPRSQPALRRQRPHWCTTDTDDDVARSLALAAATESVPRWWPWVSRIPRLGAIVGEIITPVQPGLRPHFDPTDNDYDPTTGLSVAIIIPSMNEQQNLRQILPRITIPAQIIVVEGQDLAATEEVVAQVRPDAIVMEQTRSGKGNALVCGIARADRDVVVMLDADGSADPAEIPAFIAVLNAGADFAKGSRLLIGAGSEDLTALRRLGNIGFTALTNVLFGRRFTDLCYGYNAFRRDLVPQLMLPTAQGETPQWGDGFEIETLLACRVARSRAQVVEVPSFEFHRLHGVSNLHAWRDGKRVLRTIVDEWLSRRRPVAGRG